VNRSDASSNNLADPTPASGQVRIAILGGSSSFTPALASALADRARELPKLELCLHGRNEERLKAVTRFCNRHVRARSIPHEYVYSTSVPEASKDVEIVINQMRIGGFAGRDHDDTFPNVFDIPGDETIGPGGLASAVRSVSVVMKYVEEAVAASPDSWVINMSNPMGIVLLALNRIPGLKTFGLCELPALTLMKALSKLNLSPEEVEADYLGLNHQGWFVRLTKDGRSLLPDLFERITTKEDSEFFKIDPDVMREVSALPLPYMRIYYHTKREAEKQRSRSLSRGAELHDLSGKLYDYYRTTDNPDLPDLLKSRGLIWFKMALVPAVVALLGKSEQLIYLSEANNGDIPGLPDETIVEKRCYLGPNGSRWIPFTGPPPLNDGPLEPFLHFLRQVAAYEDKALKAALEPNIDNVKQALTAHPLGIVQQDVDELASLVMKPVEKV